MLTSTVGIVMIVIGGLVALAGLEGVVLYAALRPNWKTGPGASTEGLYETPALEGAPAHSRPLAGGIRVPAGAVR